MPQIVFISSDKAGRVRCPPAQRPAKTDPSGAPSVWGHFFPPLFIDLDTA